MALVNHAKKEINAKIVYYGPAGSGKSTALTYIYSRIKPSLRGDLKNVPAGTDSLQFFDFSPFETALPNGYRVRLHVYTLTGIVSNPATWKMTLKGADGIIIMVNPAAGHAAESRESISQLRDFLSAYGVGLHDTPAVLQLNSFITDKRTEVMTDIAAELDLSTLTTSCSNAANGEGLIEALTALSRQVLDRVRVQESPCETNSPLTYPTTTVDKAEPDRPTLSEDIDEIVDQAENSSHVALLSQEVSCERGIMRIPLEITQGTLLRRLVVTVSVELE